MVSHDPRCQKTTHVAAPTEHLVNDNLLVGGEKGQVKHVGRKRRLALSASGDSNSSYADEDYQPPASGDVDDEEDTYEEPAPKRSRHVEEADEKQSGCTDEWQVPSSPLPDEEDDEEEDSSSSENEEDDEEVVEVPHPPPRTWVAKVEWALGRRGGKGTLADIYTTIEAAFPEEVDGKRNWKAAIRSCLSKNEKRKFYKPHGSSLAGSGKDHLWSLVVPREGGATRPAVKRGRPAGRRATTTRRMTTRHARRGEEQQPPLQQQQQELAMVHPQQELMDELDDLPDVLVEQFAKEERMAQLLRQKELLEQDINRLLEDNNADCADGLSPDQEDFLSHLLA